MKPISSFFRSVNRSCKRYPWTAIVAFAVGALTGAVAIVNPILWMVVIGAMLLGRGAQLALNMDDPFWEDILL